MLDPHVWYLIFYDLSVDAIHRCLPMMGLNLPEDPVFAKTLQPVLQKYHKIPVDERGETEFVDTVFKMAERYGQSYPLRLTDWGKFIYPTETTRQQQIFRWRAVVMRGVMRPKDSPPPPLIVQHTRTTLSRFVPFSASELQPSSEWDLLYCVERDDEGISPFEWVEAAVRNYRFLYAWNLSAKDPIPRDELDRIYNWAVGEAALLRMPPGSLERPEKVLTLPASLRDF